MISSFLTYALEKGLISKEQFVSAIRDLLKPGVIISEMLNNPPVAVTEGDGQPDAPQIRHSGHEPDSVTESVT